MLGFLGLAITFILLREGGREAALADRTTTRQTAPPEIPRLVPDTLAERAVVKRKLQEALDQDGRTIEPGIAAPASGLNTPHPLQLALDEVASFSISGGIGFRRIPPQKDRAALQEAIAAGRGQGRPPEYPVLYIKDAERSPSNRRVVTGELVAALGPGVRAGEIAEEYQLSPLPAEASMVGLARFVARSGFEAMEALMKLRVDPRVALADHDFVKMVAKKAFIPNDPLFVDQWALLPEVPLPPGDLWHLNLFPPLAPPVWGDFDFPEDGIRGRGVRVGIVDDGIQLMHPDLAGGLAPSFDHHAYDLEAQMPTLERPNPPPQIRYSNGPPGSEPRKLINQAHGILIAGLVGARANNEIGVVGTAPGCEMVGIRALSWFWDDINFQLQPPGVVNSRPDPTDGDVVSPMQDVLLAAALSYLQNDAFARIFPGKTIYPGTVYQNVLPSFPDFGQAPLVHVKACPWGAPDSGNLDGPGPEVAGYVQNYVYFPGARSKAVTEGRRGLGTVFVHPAGNGRYFQLDNANNDGYANAREVICVAALARIAAPDFNDPSADHCAIYSEPGACVLVSAPGGGSYFGQKSPARINNGQPQGGTITTLGDVITTIATTDWTINEPADPNADPPITEPVFGQNSNPNPATSGDYSNGAYTRQFTGTSPASAYVSGVAALMLEANPRLSWMDVQHMLIRTARNHLDPLAYALNPEATPGVLNTLDGLDIADPQDAVAIDRDWKKNGAHIWFNHKYGAGLADARRAVDMASVGILMPPQFDHTRVDTFTSTLYKVPQPPTNSGFGVAGTVVEIPFTPLVPTDFSATHVRVRFDKISTTFVGDLLIVLVSPSGMESILKEPRIDGSDDIVGWEFNTHRYWGESGSGTWRLRVTDYAEFDEAIINPSPPVGETIPRVTLSLFGFVKPLIPVITKPASADLANPTIVQIPRGRQFSYTMSADNNPTVWFIRHPDPLHVGPILPPGIAPAPIEPEAATTYLPNRLIQGSTTDPIGATYDVEVLAANITGVSPPKYIRFVVVSPDPVTDGYTAWANHHFPPLALGNPAAAGSADSESDGGTNMAEFALGTSPTGADFSSATAFAKDGSDHWAFTFNRYLTRGFVYELQVSSTLAAGSWVTVAISDPAVNSGVPSSVQPEYSVSEGPTLPGAPEPESDHRLVTVVNDPAAPAPVYYRMKLTPPRFPLDPM